ncbi:54S ribosomal protein L31, mitochondrial [Erysiphe necator]|nr:54S ribosomal protein L31, mitochondrial [Erysiphe necator]
MLGAFNRTNSLFGGLLWKIPWRLSKFQKARQRKRLRAVDNVVSVVDKALAKQGTTLKSLEIWKKVMPTEQEMLPKDKYTIFDRKEKKYRKCLRKLPKWTRVSQRINPPGY